MYDLCDNYLEMSKHLFADGSEHAATKETLYLFCFCFFKFLFIFLLNIILVVLSSLSSSLFLIIIRYTCLDVGLRLLHPFMPFLTEELYQRLPRRSLSFLPSIMVTPFPLSSDFSPWANLQVEREIKLAQDVACSVRGILASYKYASSSPFIYFVF